VVRLRDTSHAGPELAHALHAHVRERLARYKAPKRLAFEADLPRLPNGKLEKHRLRQDYRARVERGFAPA
jgi:acyl-coenzyme A synthetase/AMP-(fatty) acid ligase